MELRKAMAWSAAWISAPIIIALLVWADMARGEWCSVAPDGRAEQDGLRWRSRVVEGRKCWYLARSVLPKSDLLWEYDQDEFNEDGKVTGRRFYSPEELRR